MKRLIVTIIIFFSFLFSKEYVITKYIEDKPIINVTFKGPDQVKKIVDMDFKVLDHFEINESAKYSFDFNYDKVTKTLKVIYKKDNQPFLIKKYRSRSYAYFPFLIHRAVYDINEYFQLPSAKFLIRKVIYSLLTAPKEASIYLSDYTLSYKKRIISGGLNIFPKWADKKQTKIYFTKYERTPVLYEYNLLTGKKKKILKSVGILIVSDVKDDKILLTMAPEGQPDVYLMDFNNKTIKRITKYPGIDVNGKFWEDKIVFVSDRYGQPYVFEKDLKSGVLRRVLHHGKNQVGVDAYNKNLVISTRETANAFKPNTFNLFLINSQDDSLKRLTMKGQNSYPNFSVDGSSVMFIKREHFSSKIGIIRLGENKVFYYPLSKMLQSFDW